MIGTVGIVEMLGAVALIFAGIWYYLVANYNFWKKLGIPGPEPSIIFGNSKDLLLVKVALADYLKNICDKFPGALMVGIYMRRTPVLIIRDPDLIKDVLIKDFSNFSDRGIPVTEDSDPLSSNLVNLEPKRWRPLRSRLSPAFTSGKMKHMFTLILECAEYFEQYVDKLVDKCEPIDCREITAKFTTDVIGSCAFGLQMNAMGDEDSEFRRMGRKVFDLNTKEKMMMMLREAAPWLYKMIGPTARSKEIAKFFMSSMKQTLEHRRKHVVRRGDFVEMLIELQDSSDRLDFELTDGLITAQAFVFFAAGFETSSTTISHALYELAQLQDVQDKLREEIVESLKANGGILSYDSIKQMKYLDMVFKETLRIRPPAVVLVRQALNAYTFTDTNITVPKKQKVWIPVWEIHHNPEHYPNPEVFDPERFTEEMCNSRHPMTYLPFGDGPRNCIGARFAVYQTKVGIIKIIAKHKVEVCEKTVIPYQANPTGMLLEPLGGIYLKFSKIERSK